ncbi:hypothetical protein FS827_19215 [Agrobacterium vitis]|uniref:pentapeptide repeat-containing protein n=1 Tax=Allorhizobium ampelinum TaxID=3025782 RepID=UPI001F197F13|nr:pentapeptide repeat-containing protein [Allorhizobium ampelinum]MCF1463441.1 hypothetical protein [Allorhizobium ampelinum]
MGNKFNNSHALWLKEGVDSWNRRRKRLDFSPQLSGVRFFDFLPADFRDAPKTSRYFEKINLSNADLSNADLSGLNFSNGKFIGANLDNADMSLSNFSRTNFTDANLSGAKVNASIFEKAVFEDANLSNVSFDGANVRKAIFSRNTDFIGNETYLNMETHSSSYAKKGEIQNIQEVEKTRRFNFKNNEELKKKNKYDVFFATNRNPSYERGKLVAFGDHDKNELFYGVCEVIVPEGHRVGSLGSPLWKRLLNRKDDRLSIDHIISLNKDMYWDFLRNKALKSHVIAAPTIFIHGYNNTFEQARIASCTDRS